MDNGVVATTASGHSTAISYGPPEAQKPPRSITARIPNQSRVMQNASPATPTR
jgi:hypothetical protein